MEYLEFRDARCKDCYKCLRECPVKAISVVGHHARIIEDRCILCGTCTHVCPQNAKFVHSELDNVKALLASDKKVFATVAPSFVSSFGLQDFAVMQTALKKLGFDEAEETAIGAKVVVDEYKILLEKGEYKNFITSSCPAVNKLIQMYYPSALPYLAKVVSPMIAHARMIKANEPEVHIVFIGPCIAKKREAEESGLIDAVLTFEDLQKLLDENNIIFKEISNDMSIKNKITNENTKVDTLKESLVQNTLQSLNANENLSTNDLNTNESLNQNKLESLKINDSEKNKAKFFPINSGIIKSFDKLPEGYEYIAIDGLKRCMDVLETIESLDKIFLELNACDYGCVNGPCSLQNSGNSIKANADIRKYVNCDSNLCEEKKDLDLCVDLNYGYPRIKNRTTQVTEHEIKDILAKTNKTKPEDELNCGACGYSTCREKAWAVANGYAVVEMCMPYMREKAESMSYEIIQNSPNGILAVDSDLKLIELSNSAKKLLGIVERDVKGRDLFEYFDPTDFISVFETGKNLYRKKVFISQTKRYVEMSITVLKEHNVMFGIMEDITDEINYENKLAKVRNDTLATTDNVIKKQMRVAQEIASLLGETTAETKVALLNLKSMLNESENKGDKE